MRRQLMFIPAIFAISFAIVACDDNDGDGDGDITTGEVRGAINTALEGTRDGANDLADDIDSKIDGGDLGKVDDKVREGWNVQCKQLSESAEDEDVGAELTDVCGDLRDALDADDGDAVSDARDRLREIAGEIKDDADNSDEKK